ncbi:MAG: hypothetical protein ACI9DF_000877 [Verrucomicrobiales bacterium]
MNCELLIVNNLRYFVLAIKLVKNSKIGFQRGASLGGSCLKLAGNGCFTDPKNSESLRIDAFLMKCVAQQGGRFVKRLIRELKRAPMRRCEGKFGRHVAMDLNRFLRIHVHRLHH